MERLRRGGRATGGVLDLLAGDDLLICPVSHDEAVPPHAVLGMIAAVTVA